MTDIVKVAFITAVPSTLAVVVGIFNRKKLGEVGVQLDGKLTEFIESAKDAAYAKGVKAEHDRNGK